ncbi:unnamed protein product, partial [Candidula unifasciata]
MHLLHLYFIDKTRGLSHLWDRLPLLLLDGPACPILNPLKIKFMNMSASLKQCYDLLNKTGRASAITISFLRKDLRDALCLFYLVLRAVDTVEDDMTIPDDIKVTMLTSFDKYLLDPTWRYTESNDEYAVVLENFPCISKSLRELPSKYRAIITERGCQIGKGMANFVGKELMTSEYINEYCKQVAGVFCIGVTRLFVASGLEPEVPDTSAIIQASLFLHKINMIRDFKKDWQCGRLYYAGDVWSKYINNPGDFLKPENFDKGVKCVNELVTDALQYLIPYLGFLKTLSSESAIKFFGIHQIMAIATLERCYNNPMVFMESVSISREETGEIIKSASILAEIVGKIQYYTER